MAIVGLLVWQWDYATPRVCVCVCVLEGQGDRLERGPEEVLRRHSKPDTSLGPAV